MAVLHKGLHEVRTRVMCNLPVNNQREEKALLQVIEYLNKLRNQGIGVTGYTYSETRPTAFHGFWWPEGANEPVHDQIVLCTVDYLLSFGSIELSQQVKSLKQTIRKWYRYYGSPQEEIWVVGTSDHASRLTLRHAAACDVAAFPAGRPIDYRK